MLKISKKLLKILGVFKFANVTNEEEKEMVVKTVLYLGAFGVIILIILMM